MNEMAMRLDMKQAGIDTDTYINRATFRAVK
jgi:hypothetical protein